MEDKKMGEIIDVWTPHWSWQWQQWLGIFRFITPFFIPFYWPKPYRCRIHVFHSKQCFISKVQSRLTQSPADLQCLKSQRPSLRSERYRDSFRVFLLCNSMPFCDVQDVVGWRWCKCLLQECSWQNFDDPLTPNGAKQSPQPLGLRPEATLAQVFGVWMCLDGSCESFRASPHWTRFPSFLSVLRKAKPMTAEKGVQATEPPEVSWQHSIDSIDVCSLSV